MTEKNNTYQDNVQFMIETYGFSEEELRGIDLKKFIEDYQLRVRGYSADEVREILSAEMDMYIDDGSTALYSIFDEEEGGTLDKQAQICRIGYYRNEGTLQQRAVFDLENKEFFVNDVVPNSLSDEHLNLLKELPARWGISDWKNYYEGEEEPSTGSLRWKLVFELEGSTYCVYGGYTKDMSHLPETYFDVDKDLQSVIKSVS